MLISTRTSRLSARASTTHRIFDADDVREKVADRVVVDEAVVDEEVPFDSGVLSRAPHRRSQAVVV